MLRTKRFFRTLRHFGLSNRTQKRLPTERRNKNRAFDTPGRTDYYWTFTYVYTFD